MLWLERKSYMERKRVKSLLLGVDALANAVKVTLGPRGRNVAFEKKFGAPAITKDGVSVAKEIELARFIRKYGRTNGA